MTPEQVGLVQESFAKVAPISEQAATLFYDRLFEIAPAVRAMFPGDLTEQRKKLMATIAIVVNGLGRLEEVLPQRVRSPSAMSLTVPRLSTIRWSAQHCCGPLKGASARHGPRQLPMPGVPPTAPCPAI